MNCRDCERDHDHCHGTLVRHGDGSAECTEGTDCLGADATHDWRAGCTDLGDPCPECREVA